MQGHVTGKHAIFSLYRSFRREISLLPTEYLRQFFRIKLGDDVRAILKTSERGGLQKRKIKRVQKDFRCVKAANAARPKAFSQLLDLAYGRSGKLRWEIMRPLLSDPNAPVPDRIIPAVEKSRPPVYSPELTALLTSSHARKAKPLSRDALSNPPALPERADPNSTSARMLGRLSKRREVNIRWRFFTNEWKKVYPPLQVSVQHLSGSDMTLPMSDEESIIRAGIRNVGLQGAGVMEDVLAVAESTSHTPHLTRRERRSLAPQDTEKAVGRPKAFQSHLPNRFVRRRYRQLLGKLPILTYTVRDKNKQDGGPSTGRYGVSLARTAVSPALRWTPDSLPEADAEQLAWASEGRTS